MLFYGDKHTIRGEVVRGKYRILDLECIVRFYFVCLFVGMQEYVGYMIECLIGIPPRAGGTSKTF